MSLHTPRPTPWFLWLFVAVLVGASVALHLGQGPSESWQIGVSSLLMAFAILAGASAMGWLPRLGADKDSETNPRRHAERNEDDEAAPRSLDGDEGRPSELPRQEALWAAVDERDVEEIQAALVGGSLVNDVDENGCSLLARAVTTGDGAMVKLLIEQGADLHLGQPLPLHVAMRQGNLAAFWLLLGAGADPVRRDEEGQDAWAVAQAEAIRTPLLFMSLLHMFPEEVQARLAPLPVVQAKHIHDLWDGWLVFRRRRRLER